MPESFRVAPCAWVVVVCVVPGCGVGTGGETDGGTTENGTTGSGTTGSGTTGSGTTGGSETGSPTTGAGEWRQICDGSQELRLAARFDEYGANTDLTEIATELGFSYLYVRGDCHYWVVSAQRPEVAEGFDLGDWQITRTGVLTPAVEEDLSRDLLYDRWTELAGDHGSYNPGDSAYSFSDGESTILCDSACSQAMGAAEVLAPVPDAARGWFDTLWDAGAELATSDPVRVDLLAITVNEGPPVSEMPCAIEWPFALDPATVAHDDMPGIVSRLVEDPAQAAELRMFRDAQLAEAMPGGCNAVLRGWPLKLYEADAPTTLLQLFLRDAVPIEGPEGGIPLPPPYLP